jgi:hypothetical protein
MTTFGARPTSRQPSGSTEFPVQNELLGRSTSITKIERPRSANQLQRPRPNVQAETTRTRMRRSSCGISWDRSVIAAAPRSQQLLGPSFMDGRHLGRPGHSFRINRNSGPVCPASDIGIALFGGLSWICTVPKKRSQPGGKLRPSRATMPGRPGTKWMWVSAPPMPINSALPVAPVQNASGPFHVLGR